MPGAFAAHELRLDPHSMGVYEKAMLFHFLHVLGSSLGNLLLLSLSINSSLQKDGFADERRVRYDSVGREGRNRYADGSRSEIDVCQSAS